MPDDIRDRICAWEAERDAIVGEEFTPERSARVEELDRLIDRAWESLAPDGNRDGIA